MEKMTLELLRTSGIILLLLVMLPVSAMAVPAASPFWDSQGEISPQGNVTVLHLPHARMVHPPIAIPIHTIDAQNTSAPKTSVPLATTSTSQNIATGTTFNGLGYDSVTPPDVQVAAGPVNLMEMDNLQGEVWNKTGVPQSSPFDLSSFFKVSSSDYISDPKVFFDNISGRWFASLTDLTTSSVKVAVSLTNDSGGSFCIYNVQGSNSLILDQPIIGISDDKFVVSVNNFNKITGFFKNAQYWILNKGQMQTCSNVNYVSKTSNSLFSIHPVQSLTSTTTQYMVNTQRPSTINLFSITGVPPNTVKVSTNSLSVSSIQNPPGAIQEGTNFMLDTGDTRIQDAVWANNVLWLAHNNQCTPSSDGTPRSCLHLVQINTATKTVNQDFDYGVPGKYVFYPALRIIPSNMSLFLVTGFSSSTDYPGINVTEQLTSDPPNTLKAPVLLQKGQGPVTLTYGCYSNVCRYGDYFGAGLDPSVSNSVWVAGEYGSGVLDPTYGPAWGTQIGNFTG